MLRHARLNGKSYCHVMDGEVGKNVSYVMSDVGSGTLSFYVGSPLTHVIRLLVILIFKISKVSHSIIHISADWPEPKLSQLRTQLNLSAIVLTSEKYSRYLIFF